jgi:hypothetical protein
MTLMLPVQAGGLDSSGSDEGPVVGSCKHSTEPSSPIKGG